MLMCKRVLLAARAGTRKTQKTHRSLRCRQCRCRRVAAHLKHADLVLEAVMEVRRERLRRPHLGWRKAQEVVAARHRKAVLTGLQPLVA